MSVYVLYYYTIIYAHPHIICDIYVGRQGRGGEREKSRGKTKKEEEHETKQ
jgi:hypothetical protein